MGRYQTYPEYHDSRLPWVGPVPRHWTVSKVKYHTTFQVGWTPPTGRNENFVGDNLWANISDIHEKVVSDTTKRISDAAAAAASMSITPAGSLLYSFKLSVGAVAFAGCDMYTNEAIASFLQDMKALLNYLYYALPIFVIENASENIYGAKILNQELIRNAPLVLPTPAEQEIIATFLDHETTRIDRLIAKQERLIKLLKEKRQAVISHAVTKGLNPDAPMRDSGVEWLGEVPVHWNVTCLKYETSHIVDCLHSTPHYTDNGGFPAIRTADIFLGYLDLSRVRRVKEDEYRQRIARLEPKSGDILYSREGERFGMAAIVPDGTNLCLGQRVMMFRADVETDCHFLMWSLNATSTYRQAQQDVIGATSPHINVETIRNFWLAHPPLYEQIEISNWVAASIGKTDLLIEKARHSIDLMFEHRTALISAAVTGKIDVRGWQKPNTELEGVAATVSA